MPGPLFLAQLWGGKRPRRRWIINTASTGGLLLHLKDKHTGLTFLVDTGASCSILPHRSTAPATGPHLIIADGQPIPAWGTHKQTLKFGSFHFTFPFVLATVAFPILGNDFLAAHHLLIDPAQPAVIHRPSGHLLPLSPPISPPSFLLSLSDLPSSLQTLLHSFPTVFSSDLQNLSPHHGVQHHIHTTGPPVFAKARCLDPLRLQQAKAEFAKLEAAGIIRCSNSPWSSPLHLVPKPDGSWRPCGDYCCLNLATTPDCYPLPNLQDLTARLHGTTIFSKLDLVKAYHQVPVHPSDIPKTAVITPFGLFEYLYSTCPMASVMQPRPFSV